MNDKMRTYLKNAFEYMEVNILEARMLASDARNMMMLERIAAIEQYKNHIFHAVLESENCDECQLHELVDAPGPTTEPTKETEMRIHLDEVQPRTPNGRRVTIVQSTHATGSGNHYVGVVTDDGELTEILYRGSYTQCLLAYGAWTLEPYRTLGEIDDDTLGALSAKQ